MGEICFYLYILIVLILGLIRFVESDFCTSDETIGYEYSSIKKIYNSSNMNIFGCTFVFIVWHLFTPITTIFQIFNWLFHVERKDKE